MKIAASVTPNKTSFGPLLFPGRMEESVEKLAELGYDGIELSLRSVKDIESDYLFKILDKNNLKLLSIATGQSYIEDGVSIFSWEESARELVFSRIKDYIDLASIQDSTVILGGIKGRLDGIDDDRQYNWGVDTLKRCVEKAESKKVILLLEPINRYESNIFNTVDESSKMVMQLKSDYIKVLPDTFHMNIEEVSIIDTIRKNGKYIGALHCADSNRLAPGMGHIDFISIVKETKKLPVLRYLGVEVLPKPDSSSCAETAIHTLRKYLDEE